jgi:hypothetical protein
MRKGCFVCGKGMDRIFIFSTPEGKYKLCRGCFEMAKHIAANAEVVEDEEIEDEEED